MAVAMPVRRRAARTARVTVGTILALGAGFAVAPLIVDQPLVVLALPVAMGSAYVCRRHPLPMLLLLFAFTGAHGSMRAYLHLSGGQLTDLVLAGLWIGLLLSAMVPERPRRLFQPELIPLIAFVLVTLSMLPFAPDSNLAIRDFRASTWYILGALVIAYSTWPRALYVTLAKGIVVIGILCGGYAALRWGIGHPSDKEQALTKAALAKYNEVIFGEEKVQGALPSGHEMGFWMCVVTPFYVTMALCWRGLWRIIALVAAGLCLIGLLASGHRSGVVGVAGGTLVALLLILVSRGYQGPRIGTALCAAALIVGGSAFAFVHVVGNNPEKVQRYKNIAHPSQDLPVQERLFKWSNAFMEIEDRPFGRGLGTGGSSSVEQRFPGNASNEVDNSYVKIAYEQGFGVMVLFIVAMLALFFGVVRRAIWTRSPQSATLAIGAAATLMSMGIVLMGGLYIDRLSALAAWMIVGIGLAQFATPEPDPIVALDPDTGPAAEPVPA